MKHIESIQPELAADDITRLLADDDATATAALTRLLHDWTGCAIPPTATIPESEVEELVPLCVSILRRHWQTPLTCLGDGTTPMSLSDLLRQSIGDRVQGNEAWSIPPSNANIPTALAALRQRDMSSGLTLTLSDGTTTSLPDGISLAQLLCGSDVADTITELKDDNVGWTADVSNALLRLMQIFDNARLFTLNCKKATQRLLDEFRDGIDREYDLHFPMLGDIGDVNVIGQYYVDRMPTMNVYLNALKHTNQTANTSSSFYARRIYMPNYESGSYRQGGSGTYSNPNTTYMMVGCKGKNTELARIWSYTVNNITDFEIADGACMSITLQGFDNLTAENMYNHILCRLKQDEPMCGEGVTITLGTTNLDKLEAVEEYNLKLTELTDTYGYTFA